MSQQVEKDKEEADFSKELEQIPKPGVPHIKLLKIENIVIPHLYCVTPKHLKHNEGIYLNIEGAEKRSREAHPNDPRRWAVCDVCRVINRETGKPILPYSEHKKQKTLFIEVPQNKDLNAVEGLNAYLRVIKPVLGTLKIDGIAFPTVAQKKSS